MMKLYIDVATVDVTGDIPIYGEFFRFVSFPLFFCPNRFENKMEDKDGFF